MGLDLKIAKAGAIRGRQQNCLGAVNIPIPGGNVLTQVNSTGVLNFTNTNKVPTLFFMAVETAGLLYSAVGAGLYRFQYEIFENGVSSGIISQDWHSQDTALETESKMIIFRFNAGLAAGGTRSLEIRLHAQADNPGLTILGSCLEISVLGVPRV